MFRPVRSCIRGPRVAALVVALSAAAWGVAPAAADTLEAQLRELAPEITKKLKEAKYENVGVLKFLVKTGEDNASDNAGPLNFTMARRLTVALIQEAGREFKKTPKTLNIIGDANAIAATIKGATHISPKKEDVLRLFEKKYPLAWGTEPVTPTAFLTGVVHIQPDFRTATVTVSSINAKAQVHKVTTFTAEMTPDLLAEAGVSFLRTLTDENEKFEIVKGGAAGSAEKAKQGEAKHPLNDARNSPVALQIYYGPADPDQGPMRLVFDGGKQPFTLGKTLDVEVEGPRPGERVEFKLIRNPKAGEERFGVVLMVNGENTLYRERKDYEKCTKWILDPGDKPTPVRGYQIKGQDNALHFKALPLAEAQSVEQHYLPDRVGLFEMVVFRGLGNREQPPAVPVARKDQEEKAIRDADLPPADLPAGESPPKDPEDAANRFLDAAGLRLLIPDEGHSFHNPVQMVPFTTDPTPVMSVRIRYYKPVGKPK